jgi:hypothetical protein
MAVIDMTLQVGLGAEALPTACIRAFVVLAMISLVVSIKIRLINDIRGPFDF